MNRLQTASGYLVASALLVGLTTVLAPLLDERHIVDVALLYLLLTLVVAARWGYGVGVFTAIGADKLGRIPLNDAIQELDLPGKPHAVVADEADGVWVSLWGADAIARVTADGEVSTFDLPPGTIAVTIAGTNPATMSPARRPTERMRRDRLKTFIIDSPDVWNALSG